MYDEILIQNLKTIRDCIISKGQLPLSSVANLTDAISRIECSHKINLSQIEHLVRIKSSLDVIFGSNSWLMSQNQINKIIEKNAKTYRELIGYSVPEEEENYLTNQK